MFIFYKKEKTMWNRRMKFIGGMVVSLMGLFLFLAINPVQASQVVASASGGSQLKIHNMFGLELIDVRTYAFNAVKRADGTVTGNYVHRSLDDGVPFYADGPVTCLNVNGNNAWVGGLIENSSEPSIVGWQMWFQVEDNGEGNNGLSDWTTLLGASPDPGSAQACCDDAPAVRFPFDIDHGNIQVNSN
jgi:hypothetical protein